MCVCVWNLWTGFCTAYRKRLKLTVLYHLLEEAQGKAEGVRGLGGPVGIGPPPFLGSNPTCYYMISIVSNEAYQ